MTERYDEYLHTARVAATEAADVLRERFRGEYRVGYKDGGDPVTDVDLAAERAIRETIVDRHPAHAIRGEESGHSGCSSLTWVVDPLDGTANYVTGFDHYCVSIALVRDGEPLVGVVVVPERDDRYAAVANGGATCNGDPISVSEVGSVTDGSVLVGISPPAADDERFQETVERLRGAGRSRGLRRLGAGAYDLSLVANGTFDCFLDTYTSPWDVAAGSLLVTEAGGRVTDLRGDPIDLTVGERELHVLATNGTIHDELRGIYREAAGASPSQ